MPLRSSPSRVWPCARLATASLVVVTTLSGCAILQRIFGSSETEDDPIGGTVTVVFNVEEAVVTHAFEGIEVCKPEDLPPINVGPNQPPVQIKVHVTRKGRRTARVRFACDGGELGPEVTLTYGGGAVDTGCRAKDGRRILVDVRPT